MKRNVIKVIFPILFDIFISSVCIAQNINSIEGKWEYQYTESLDENGEYRVLCNECPILEFINDSEYVYYTGKDTTGIFNCNLIAPNIIIFENKERMIFEKGAYVYNIIMYENKQYLIFYRKLDKIVFEYIGSVLD